MNKIELLIGGKSRPVKLGLRFLENVTTSEGITIVDVFTKFESETLFFLPKLIYYAINTANPDTLTLDDVYDWVDEIGIASEEIKPFIIAFADSMKVHIPQEDEKVGKQKAKMS